ncbi:acyl-CoA dehydrogenase [Phenylobacterium sp.]|uniref:acyl-CoA dehydrogenase family protein n=1 Tax=Phenylobacterium sp. TaxID=1871053 RepID=UPI00301BE7CD
MASDEQASMIRDLVRRFVVRELAPLEPKVLARQARNEPSLTAEESERLRKVSKELGLWGLDAPTDMGGMDLPATVMMGVAEELAKTMTPFTIPPDSPNLRMMQAVGSPAQKEKYLQPYIEGRLTSAIAISEPGAGGDPAGMKTRAVRDADGWVIDGRKIWISNARNADFTIVMARVGEGERQEGVTAFIVERGTPGFIIEREIPMLGAATTYEIVFDECRVPEDAVLGQIGQGYGPMQLRLQTRRLQMAATALGYTERAVALLSEHARQRVTFGVALADRQAIQWWVADTTIKAHACRLMIEDAAAKADAGEDVRHEISIVKVFATETAYAAVDHAMQTLGALGMTQETPLYPMWLRARLMRIYEGPSEVHRQTIARRVMGRPRTPAA